MHQLNDSTQLLHFLTDHNIEANQYSIECYTLRLCHSYYTHLYIFRLHKHVLLARLTHVL